MASSHTQDLGVSLGTLKLHNPLIAASGCYGYGVEYSDVADRNDLGGFITKSISLEPWKGNDPPRLTEVSPGLLNSIGLANMGVQRFSDEIAPQIVGGKAKAIVSVACKVMEEYEEVVARLEDVEGLDGYELNISCPNVKEGGMAFCLNPSLTEELVGRVRKRSSRWITTKLTPNMTSISEGAKASAAGGADAVSLINTLVGMAVDWKSRRPKLSTITGGYSGPPVKPVALAKVWEVWNAVDIPIIGIGGISNWKDVVEFMIVGASAVQIGTALYADPDLPGKIVSDLEDFMRSEGMNLLSELTGSLNTDGGAMVGVPK
ncbi:MAG TPA: dihydroorotate dehydrogenase [Bacteroidetes bacterium]|nr:dihydroorotate dehydrogenase [Bacteroidota bacterium]HEX03737.1 dihydroorotate dehydrogenase [Bacteroidota bacterium]